MSNYYSSETDTYTESRTDYRDDYDDNNRRYDNDDRYDDSERITETETYIRDDNDRYDNNNRYDNDRYNDSERITETETYTSSNTYDGPDVPYPWRPRWSDRERRYVFVHQETGEEVWEYEDVIRRTRGGRGEYVGERIRDDYEEDKYRVENDVEYAPENAAQWAGRRVGEVERIPQDMEYGVERFDGRVEQRFDNAVDDVEYAPERLAGWAGRKVGDVERFDDNVDNAYDEGRYEGRNDRW